MPGLGALIDPKGYAGTALSQGEYEILHTCLEMHRSDNHELRAVAETIGYISKPEHRTFPWYVNFLLSNLGKSHVEEISGMLAGGGNPIFLYYDEDYFKDLSALLEILRKGGWFAEFLSLQLRAIAAGSPTPTPLGLMQALTDDVEQFELQLATAKRLHQAHPELFITNPPAARGATP
jgi:hypothetical protein